MFDKNENTTNVDKSLLQGGNPGDLPSTQSASVSPNDVVQNNPDFHDKNENDSSLFNVPDSAISESNNTTTPNNLDNFIDNTTSYNNKDNDTFSQDGGSTKQSVQDTGFSLQKLQQAKGIEANNIDFVSDNKGDGLKCKKKNSCIFTILYVFIGLGLLVIAGLISYDRYISLLLSPTMNSKERQYTIKYNNNLQKIKDYINPTQTAKISLDLSNTGSYDTIASFISNDKFSFIEKKDNINQALSSYSKYIATSKSDLESAKQNITEYGYIPVEVDGILGDDKKITTIENSLLSLETIKFASAINVFSYLDTFLNSLARPLYMTKDQIQQEMTNITKDGEKHINLYIKKCYLNPFEYDYSCNVIGDFDRYYSMVKEEKTFNTKLFKQLVYYLDLKLEFTDIPSFNIMFQKFDANSETITFSIDINTFKQDELELAKKGIINPHIFILTNLINSLKQSKFVVGKNLKVDNLNVNESVFKIGLTEFIVNNSKKVYTLPIQKTTQREIFDFID